MTCAKRRPLSPGEVSHDAPDLRRVLPALRSEVRLCLAQTEIPGAGDVQVLRRCDLATVGLDASSDDGQGNAGATCARVKATSRSGCRARPHLQPHVGLKRTPLRRSTPLSRGGPLRKVSKKRRAKYPARLACVREVAERSGGACEARISPRCRGRACDPHEVKTRGRGGDDTDAGNVLAVCRECHSWIGRNQALALSLGLLASSYRHVEGRRE
jgi:hypothetical protein